MAWAQTSSVCRRGFPAVLHCVLACTTQVHTCRSPPVCSLFGWHISGRGKPWHSQRPQLVGKSVNPCGSAGPFGFNQLGSLAGMPGHSLLIGDCFVCNPSSIYFMLPVLKSSNKKGPSLSRVSAAGNWAFSRKHAAGGGPGTEHGCAAAEPPVSSCSGCRACQSGWGQRCTTSRQVRSRTQAQVQNPLIRGTE